MTELKNKINVKLFKGMAVIQLATIELKNKVRNKLVSNEGAISDYAAGAAIGLVGAAIILGIIKVLLKDEVEPGLTAKTKEIFSTK
ncbi:hypothetical protein EDD70_2359 [Hydrogenoanaerobacterium saccharovorans]|uniref:Uncharacterized protein n=1 Tax=Hydrogenoanaerobacterium saccharovorans TaxID=474960 RepID=A0A1H8CYS9_9FIRM|nr:hypothetical protein [Hydrogenoanaerobacterium saccharovorans]RPF43395.1 hypothetical protein EDD70_2359 [Hydrogenoanaerobacterium saccharovorans]SEN00253.1 hypothetical protein SAMN05216180_2417 [Hydrogenoanaerobacterium saccharovorans]